jgi:hypothetical protein
MTIDNIYLSPSPSLSLSCFSPFVPYCYWNSLVICPLPAITHKNFQNLDISAPFPTLVLYVSVLKILK